MSLIHRRNEENKREPKESESGGQRLPKPILIGEAKPS